MPAFAIVHELRAPLVQVGQSKALIQAALKLTSPGVPDIYRGAEDWEQSFVDPDNRRPVDFSALRRRLAGPNGPVDQKLVLTQKLLRFRQSHPELFTHTSYQPIDMGETTLAFLREAGNARLLVMADLSPGHDAGLSLPQNLAVQQWTDVITGSAYSLGERQSVLVLWQ